MADKRLNLIVDLVNKTEGKFKEVAKDFDALNKRTETMQAAFGGMAKAGTVAFAAIAGAGVFAVKAYADAQRQAAVASIAVENALTKMSAQQRKVSTGFADATQALGAVKLAMKEAGDAAQQLGFDDDAASLAFAKLYQASGSVTAAQRDLKIAMDLSAFSGKSLEESQRAILMAYAGGTKALREFGVEVEDGATKLDVLRTLQDKTGGSAARMAETISGQMARLKESLDDVTKAVGAGLAPQVDELLKKIKPVVDKTVGWIQDNSKLVSTLMLSAGAVAAVVAVLGTLGITMLAVSSGLAALKVAVLAFANVWGAAIAVVVFTGTVLRKLILDFGEFSTEVGGAGNAFKLTMKQMTISSMEMARGVLQGLNNVTGAIPGWGAALDKSIAGIDTMIINANADLAEFAVKVSVPGQAAETTAGKIAEVTPAIVTDIGKWDDASGATTDKMKKDFDSLVSAVSEVKKEITAVYADIKKAALDFQKSVAGEKTSYEEEVAQTVAEAYNEKGKLEMELQQALSKGETDRVSELQASIAQQTAIITSYQQTRLQLDAQIAEERARLQMNEVERLTFDHQKKLQMMEVEYLTEQVARLQKIKELQAENDQILAMTDKAKKAKILADAAQTVSMRERIAAEKTAQTNWLSESVSMYQSYANQINSIMASINTSTGARVGVSIATANARASGTRASGGAVQPGRTFLVGERGPELFTPQQYGQIQANGGGAMVVVNISGNSFVGEQDLLDKVGDSLMKAIQRNIRL